MFRLIAGLTLALTLAGGAAARPFVAILADPRGTVAPDVLAPYAILAESGAVEVKVVSPTRAPVRLTPGHAWVAPQMTLAEAAAAQPDVIIVPAMSVVEDAARTAWLKEQAALGARVMSICNGAKVLAATGLLEGREATVHWFSRGRLSRAYPGVTWRDDRRWVADGPIVTTAGISAAEPATLHLVGELAGEPVMQATAARLGMPAPDPRHDGQAFRLTVRNMVLTVVNKLAFWRHEDVALPLASGMDELAFGAALDGWSRTYRSTAWAVGDAAATSRHGLVLSPSAQRPQSFDRRVSVPGADADRATFEAIGLAYGRPTARFVAMQFEHPYGALPRH
ncbi:MAG: DJ-1/PfpI family protein [Phenylobacterium sp.]|uniref:DJ-1/PfpI family protein n=1 Tax=Phenylobacterium sp. TaxID=1871053 RepID=UPI00391B5071